MIFKIVQSKEMRGDRYVLARKESSGPFLVSEGATLGGVALASWLKMPKAFRSYRRGREDLFAFRLSDQSAVELKPGERVALECPDAHLCCPQCGATLPHPNRLANEVYRQAVRLHRDGNSAGAMQPLRAKGLTIKESKALVLHISLRDTECHRCGAARSVPEHGICPSCHALNLVSGLPSAGQEESR